MAWRGLLAFAGALAAAVAAAADERWLARPAPPESSRSIDLEPLALAPERLSALEQAQTGFTDLLFRLDSHIGRDGVVRDRVTQVRRFLSPSGVDQGSNLELKVLPSYENLRIETVYVVTAQGQRIDANPSTIQVTDDDQPRIFSDARNVVVPMAGVAPGSTAVMIYETRFRSGDWILPWSAAFQLQLVSPFERFEATIGWDSEVQPLRWKTNDPKLACTEGERRLHCVKERADGLELDADLRDLPDKLPTLVIGRSLSWNELARQVRAVVEAPIEPGLPDSVLTPILAGADSAEQKWQALYRFVADEVRYLGLEHQEARVVPRAPRVTLDRRYGDCKDKVTLLIALARQAGLSAYPALVATSRFDPAGFLMPSTQGFDHMIACRESGPENDRCVDPTVPNVPGPVSVASRGGAVMLELRPEVREPRALPAPDFGWDVEIEGRIEVGCEGDLRSTIKRRIQGLGRLVYRELLAAAPRAEQQRLLGAEYHEATGKATDAPFEIDGLKDAMQALSITSRQRSPSSTRLVALDSIKDVESESWIRMHGLSFRSQNRHHPFRNPGLRASSRLEYQLCDEVEPTFLGPALDFQSEFGGLTRSYARERSVVRVTTVLELPKSVVEAERIADYNGFLEKSLAETAVWFSLTRRP